MTKLLQTFVDATAVGSLYALIARAYMAKHGYGFPSGWVSQSDYRAAVKRGGGGPGGGGGGGGSGGGGGGGLNW